MSEQERQEGTSGGNADDFAGKAQPGAAEGQEEEARDRQEGSYETGLDPSLEPQKKDDASGTTVDGR